VSALLKKTLRDQQRAFLAWGIGVAGVAAMYSAFYPSVRHSAADLQRYLEKLPEAIKNLFGGDFTTPAGYLRSETFSVLGPILFLVFAIGAGSRAIAGEEEARTLDLLLSMPIRRRQVLVDKWIAIVATTFALALVLGLTIALVGPPFDLHVGIIDLAASCLMLFLLAVTFGTIALAVGCFTGRRGLANGVAGALATIAYVSNVLASAVPGLAPLRPLSPFRWYLEPDPLIHGVAAINFLVLVAIAAASYIAASFFFVRRDLRA
jgi:ABC-type transport system involved in multi-copper enzyme maturation, permease component